MCLALVLVLLLFDCAWASEVAQETGREVAGRVADNSSGPNALYTLVHAHGYRVDHQQILGFFSRGKRDVSITDLKLCVRESGADAMLVHCSAEALDHLALPVVALMSDGDSDHYVVLTKVDSGAVTILDGRSGRSYELLRSTFASRWSGYLLVVLPASGGRCCWAVFTLIVLSGISVIIAEVMQCRALAGEGPLPLTANNRDLEAPPQNLSSPSKNT